MDVVRLPRVAVLVYEFDEADNVLGVSLSPFHPSNPSRQRGSKRQQNMVHQMSCGYLPRERSDCLNSVMTSALGSLGLDSLWWTYSSTRMTS